ncbi:MAG: hypothetical protein WCT50_05135 [Patescibacteria group bacterium]
MGLKIKKTKSGSAMILTMFILAGMLIVAMGGSYVVLLGIKAGGVQAQSTKAYFAAESGAEDVLWQIRKKVPPLIHLSQVTSNPSVLISGLIGDEQAYEVYYTKRVPRTYMSVGDSRNTKRGVEVSW